MADTDVGPGSGEMMMAVSTDKLIPGVLPPKEEQGGTDFLRILDDFDPSALSEDVLRVFASRNPFETAYGWETAYYQYEGLTYELPCEPAQFRLSIAKRSMESDRDDLLEEVSKYQAGFPNAYTRCRRALIKAIGSKTCAFIVEKEVDALTPDQCRQQEIDYERFRKYAHEEWEARQQQEPEWIYQPAARNEKVAAVRKGCKNSSGRPFKQRDFAKLIGYPVNKYIAAEKEDAAVGDELLEKLIMICHANPFFLYDDDCDAYMGEYEGDVVDMGDAPAILVDLDIILKWIKAGKPRVTSWLDGVTV